MEVVGEKMKRGQGNKGVLRELEENIGVWWKAKKKCSVFLVHFPKQLRVDSGARETKRSLDQRFSRDDSSLSKLLSQQD